MLLLLLSAYEESFVKLYVYLQGFEEIKYFVDQFTNAKVEIYIKKKFYIYFV